MNKKVTRLTVLLLGMFMLFNISVSRANSDERDSIPETAYSFGYPLGLGVHFGSTGFGAQFYYPLGQQFGMRLGVSYMPFSTNIEGTYSNRATRSEAKAKSSNASAIFGWTPFVNNRGFFRSFNVQVGGAYFFKLDGTLTTRLADPYRYGDIAVDPEMVGTIKTNVAWKKTVNPYAGIGWSNILIDSRFSMHVDLGCYYLSKPSVTMEATGLLEENVNNAATIENNIKNYRYLPRIEAGVSYRFK